MSQQIKVGDLVMLVRGHECAIKVAGGIPFTVIGIVAPFGGGWTCPDCGMRNAGPNENGAAGFRKKSGGAIPLSWLIKIDPPAIPESVERKEEMPA